MTSDEHWLEVAVERATHNVTAGGGPFGAVIVRDGVVLGEGENRVTRDNDPTAHAEVTAIRRACAAEATFALPGATLYTSCEPCPLCMAATMWARLDRCVYAADRHDAARGGFDDLEFYDLFARDRATWDLRVEGIAVDSRVAPFDAWLSSATRVGY